MTDYKLILASGSPRRKEILEQVGIRFEVIPSKYEEDMTLEMPPSGLVKHLSHGKAAEVATRVKDGIILGSDTIVFAKGQKLGKPEDKNDAVEILKTLSGGTHSVFTGYTLIDLDQDEEVSRSVETKVTFRELSETEIIHYVKVENVLDKAGAYAVQDIGAGLVSRIEGEYYNVIGLPIASVIKDLQKLGVEIWG